MNRRILHISSCLFFLAISFVSFSQAVTVKAVINRNKILIGEPIVLKLEATVPDGTDAAWFPIDSMTHFDIVDKGKIDTIATGGSKTFRQTLVITSFDSGRWAIPSLPLQSGIKDFLTDSIPVSVGYSNFDPQQDYHDIKDILEVPNPNTGFIDWVIAGLVLVSVIAVVYFLRKKGVAIEQPVVKKSVSRLSPLQEALQELEVLQKQGWSANGQAKAFHTRLNDIFRWYLSRRGNLPAMKETSGELMLQLRQFNMDSDAFTRLAQTLRMGDAVKFAKYQPATAENEAALASVKQSIGDLENIISSSSLR